MSSVKDNKLTRQAVKKLPDITNVDQNPTHLGQPTDSYNKLVSLVIGNSLKM